MSDDEKPFDDFFLDPDGAPAAGFDFAKMIKMELRDVREREERRRREAERSVPPAPPSDSDILGSWASDGTGVDPRPPIMMPQPRVVPNGGRPSRRQKFDGRTMPWGKHQGVKLEEVPVQYVGWMFSEQLAGEMLLPDDLASALLAAFLRRLRALPVYARELDALCRIPRAVDDGRRAPTVTGDEEV